MTSLEKEYIGADGLSSVLLIDDDINELERARDKDIQTYFEFVLRNDNPPQL